MFNPIAWALKRPVTVLTLAVGLLLLGLVARSRMRTDIFPNLNLPVIYVCQPYGGMDPSQMEGLLTNYYEYHFLYINGIHHVESRNVQGLALMKLFFHPGTDMAQAMAETMGYVTRSRAFMPPGTVSPFVTRFDAGSIPVGYLVLSSETRTINEIQDQALFKVRPMFSGLPGVSAPPPFGGTQRTIVVRLDPDRLRSYRMAPDEITQALNTGNAISPSGTVRFGDSMPIVPVNALARDVEEFKQIPIRPGKLPTVHLGDVASVSDSADVPVGSALINGRKAVYLLVTKRADASTLDVISAVRNALPEMQAVLPPDIKVALEFDQSPTVTNAVHAVVTEAALGAGLVGLMVLLFLRDWRSMIVVIVNIPLALAGAVTLLWLTDQTFNLMTLGGLALAIGILVDESTVEVENIHTQLEHTQNVPVAVRRGNRETAVPRLLALLCMLAVFAPSFLMTGAVRSLFVPLSLAVGFSMISSYFLSSTLVPVLSAYLLKPHRQTHSPADAKGSDATAARPIRRFARPIQTAIVAAYVAACGFGIWSLAPSAGFEIFPKVDSGRFQVRVKAPAGTRYEKTERIVTDVLDAVNRIVGKDGVEVSVGYVGNIASSYPIQAIFQWTGGPEEAFLRVALNPEKALYSVDETKERLRDEMTKLYPDVLFSLEPADIVSEVMSFGSPTPVDVVVSGSAYADVRAHAARVRAALANIDGLRDLRYGQTLDYPALRVNIDRRLAGLAGLSAADVARSLVTATSSSRFILPSYWPDPKSGIGYQVQVEIPYASIVKTEDLENLPVNEGFGASPVVLRDVASVRPDIVPGEFDRYNMKRLISLTANVTDDDLAKAARDVRAAVAEAGAPPAGVKVDIRGQLATLDEINAAGTSALIFTFVVILLMLTAYYQSIGLALVSLASVPAVGLGITLTLLVTGTTWNLQSYMGSIMALGVSVANAILLVSFAETERRAGAEAGEAARLALRRRVRPILMTALAMIAGMAPMAMGLSEGGRQQAPLGRAVIGGLLGSLAAVMLITPRAFAVVRKGASMANQSLDPTDPDSPAYDPDADKPYSAREVSVSRASVAILLVISAVHGFSSPLMAQQAGAPRVTVADAAPAHIEHRIDQPGQVEPQQATPLESRVSGWIKAIHADIGDRVSAGQVLIEVDAPELVALVSVSRAQLDQAKAESALTEAQYKETEGTLQAQQARLNAAKAVLGGREALARQMELELERMKRLVSSGAVTRSVMDEAEQRSLSAAADLLQSQALLVAAQADAETIKSQLVRRRAEIDVARSRESVAVARLVEAEARSGLTKIAAPFDGVVTERNADPGKLVGDAPGAKPLMIIADGSVLTVTVGIPEAEAPLVDIGDATVIFTSQDIAAPAFTGKVSRISRSYDPVTRTMRCEIDVPSESTSLRSGQYVLVRIIGHKKDEPVTVPTSAVFKVAGVSYACVATGGKTERRRLEPGIGDGIRVAVTSGLKAGETVVVGPAAATLADGTAVEVVRPEPAKP
jgi:RND family efflux transporter MFP subunit